MKIVLLSWVKAIILDANWWIDTLLCFQAKSHPIAFICPHLSNFGPPKKVKIGKNRIFSQVLPILTPFTFNMGN